MQEPLLLGAVMRWLLYFINYCDDHPFKDIVTFFVPVAAITLAAACICALLYGKTLPSTVGASIDHIIVDCQLARLQDSPGDIVVIGDSSGLMGIDSAMLAKQLGKTVENFSTIGYAGPSGYAMIFNAYRNKHGNPAKLILPFHPVQFARDRSWETWVEIIKSTLAPSQDARERDWLIMWQQLRAKLYSSLLFIPLQRLYGAFYGSPEAVKKILRDQHGGMIDPATGFLPIALPASSPLQAYTLPDSQTSIPYERLTISDEYILALKILYQVIQDYGPENVILVMTPLPQAYSAYQDSVFEDYHQIATLLGIPDHNVITNCMPFALPDTAFSSYSHLNRIGRAMFSEALGKELISRDKL